MDIVEVGDAVRQRRRDMGYTQQKLAELSGLSRTRINQMEAGRAFDMKLGSIVSILDALGMSLRISESRDARPVFEDIWKESEDGAPSLG